MSARPGYNPEVVQAALEHINGALAMMFVRMGPPPSNFLVARLQLTEKYASVEPARPLVAPVQLSSEYTSWLASREARRR